MTENPGAPVPSEPTTPDRDEFVQSLISEIQRLRARVEVGPSPEQIAQLTRAGDHLAHTLRAIYSWWEKGENVLDINAEWAKDGLEMWVAACSVRGSEETK